MNRKKKQRIREVLIHMYYLTEVSIREYIDFVRANEQFFEDGSGNAIFLNGLREIKKKGTHDENYSDAEVENDIKYLVEQSFSPR